MHTLLLNATFPQDIKRAARILKDGDLVAFATETVYGLGGLGFNLASIEKIFIAKNRPLKNPLIFHIHEKQQAKLLFDFEACPQPSMTKHWFNQLSRHFWPGPLTLVCYKTSQVPLLATGGLPKVAVRMSSHPSALVLLQEVGEPLVAPSANLSTRPSPTTAAHVGLTLNNRIEAILDGGSCHYGLESSVVDISSTPPTLLRLGAITPAELAPFLPDLKVGAAGKESQATGSPGLHFKHYAPKVSSIRLVDTTQLSDFWHTPIGLMVTEKTAHALTKKYLSRQAPAAWLEIFPADPKALAASLYAAFYRLESAQVPALIIEKPAGQVFEGLWLAIYDRLVRACL